ncbi:MAG: PilZ domain-containing protein [Bryobacteraceae bacterium]
MIVPDDPKELRSQARLPFQAPLQLAWQSRDGKFRRVQGAARDVSRQGLQLELNEPVEVGARVNVRCADFEAFGSATVAYCRQEGEVWVAGLSFPRALLWVVRPQRTES